VLTYLCAERPIVGVMPRGNSVAEILLEHQAGLVVDPSEREAIPEAVTRLLDNPEEARTMGRAGRTYAEREFSPLNAALRFESIFSQWVTIPARPVDPDVVPVDHDAPLPMEV
jgi:glycosyltransferase involved in cell wall biosynthesis